MHIVKNLSKHYTTKNIKGKKTQVISVKNISFTIEDNQSYSLVGESGSGKSTLARLITGIEKPTRGEILLNNENIADMSKKKMRKFRSQFQLVMQDGQGSLNPRMKVYDIIAEPLKNFLKLSKTQEQQRINQLLKQVELPIEFANRYPHELSGGQQKRVCIARAISIKPQLIVFDEVVSGLDTTIKKKILDLLINLRQQTSCSYLFITHDIDVAIYMSKNILVMKDGEVVEYIKNIKSFADFKHEYSKMLIQFLPPKTPEIR